jgi:hypothetical protein
MNYRLRSINYVENPAIYNYPFETTGRDSVLHGYIFISHFVVSAVVIFAKKKKKYHEI